MTDRGDFGGEGFNHQQEQCSHKIQTEQLITAYSQSVMENSTNSSKQAS